MKRIAVLFSLLSVFFLTSLLGCDKANRIEILRHKNDVQKLRTEKDKFFTFSEDSPIPDTERWQFKKLDYFPIDIQYRVKAKFTSIAQPKEFSITTSAGPARVYVTLGRLDFKLLGKDLTLMAYQDKSVLGQGSTSLFVPFTDQTSGRETYGAGRYMDVSMPGADGEMELDFNLAYSPYCAYNLNYSCPIPPAENHLLVAVAAGEKSFKKM